MKEESKYRVCALRMVSAIVEPDLKHASASAASLSNLRSRYSVLFIPSLASYVISYQLTMYSLAESVNLIQLRGIHDFPQGTLYSVCTRKQPFSSAVRMF